jgi:FkbM family methyltransferase|tara:strand:- start:45 stop:755 length:711 start_codon:yes stop_codon:yes gene_type:complete
MANVVRIGTHYGGFYYPEDLPGLNETSVIYCVGAGEDISHDVILSSKAKCPVHIFDPTPRAIEHVKLVKDVLDEKREPVHSKRFGGADSNYWNIIQSHKVKGDNLKLYEYGLSTNDDVVPFYFPKNSHYVSCSVIPLGRKTVSDINVPVKTLNTIMSELNHDHIDLLKIDIENIECDVVDKMLNDNIYPTYLSVDFDLWNHNRARCREVINKLAHYGYAIIKQTNQDISFIRKVKP